MTRIGNGLVRVTSATVTALLSRLIATLVGERPFHILVHHLDHPDRGRPQKDQASIRLPQQWESHLRRLKWRTT